MKSMMLRLLVAAMLLLACCVAAFAQGGTITIQGQAGTFPTIQAAINAVPEAGTVLVNGGDHQENLVITKGVQLIGQNSARINPATGNPIFVNNPSGSVQIIGFVFTIPANQVGILYDAVATTVQTGTILNCSFSGGLNSIVAREANFRIVGNIFTGFSATSIVVQGITGTISRKLRVSSNSFLGNAFAGGTVQSLTTSAMTVTDGAIQVDDNLILNVKTGILVSKCSGNVSRNEFTSAQIGMDFSDSPGVLVEQNDFSTSASFTNAFNAQGFTTAGMRLIRSGNAIVRNNTFAGGNGGIVVTQQSTGVTIDANVVRNMFTSPLGGGSGIVLTLSSSAEIHNNNIENNAFGLSVFGSAANATNNWWGAANGPSGAGGGSGSSISAGVPFTPFLTAPNPNAGAAQSG